MSKRRPLVAGNWKMNGSRAESAALVDAVRRGVGPGARVEVALCPPFILIPLVAEKLAGGPISWGGQNLDTHKSGAYTGEVSGPMLKDYDCAYVIVGHSERRALYGENDGVVAEKFGAAPGAAVSRRRGRSAETPPHSTTPRRSGRRLCPAGRTALWRSRS